MSLDSSNSTRQRTTVPISRREAICITAIVLAGLALRFAYPSRMAVEHFDEGVYASNIWFEVADGYRYPDRHLYAPPLVPAMEEWAIIALGPSRWRPLLPGLLAGWLTIALVWWTGRCWFGVEAGFAAAALAATSDYHVAFSRTALTDAPLCLFLTAGVYFGWKAVCDGRTWDVVAAAAATGLAWWSKYNGWLPLAILGAGVVAWLLVERPRSVRPASALLRLFAIAAASAALWSPVLMALEETGGYRAVAENHSRYVVGWNGWTDSFLRQLGNLNHFDGWVGVVGIAVVMGLPFVFGRTMGRRAATVRERSSTGPDGPVRSLTVAARQSTAQPRSATVAARLRVLERAGLFLACISLVLIAAVVGSSAALAVATCAGVIAEVLKLPGPGIDVGVRESRTLAVWLTAAWFCGLLLATPFYQPYPRLVLPWVVATWLGAAAWVQSVSDWLSRRVEPAGDHDASSENCERDRARAWGAWTTWGVAVAAGILLCAAFAFGRLRLPDQSVVGWEDRSRLASIADEIVDTVAEFETERPDTSGERAFYVLGEPALFYHLRANSEYAGPVERASIALRGARNAPTYLVTGPQAGEAATTVSDLEAASKLVRLVGEWEYRGSDLVLLNRYSARAVETGSVHSGWIRVYAVGSVE